MGRQTPKGIGQNTGWSRTSDVFLWHIYMYAHLYTQVFFFKNFYILCTWVFYLHVYLCTTYVPGSLKCQKRVLDLLELELRAAMRYQVGDGDCIWAVFKSGYYAL